MSDLVMRKLPFKFDGVDFMWNQGNSAFSLMMNSVSFQVIGFERYMCRATRDAEKLITDPAVLDEARMFNAQEMIHSQAHMKHCKALIAQHPGLQEVLDESVADFEALYHRESLDFHLAYAANIEATFTPFFGMIIEHREALFGGGDPRVAAVMLWHFCEEIEHRSSALTVYEHVVGKRFYRLGQLRKVVKHIGSNVAKIHEGFRKHVPGCPEGGSKGAFLAVPRPVMRRMLFGVLESQMPWHNPANGRVPAYYNDWRNGYERGDDMTALHEFAPQLAAA